MHLCFVTHGYAPQQGGTETFVQAMAEEAVGRGITVTVYTQNGEPRALNGVQIETSPNCLTTRVYNLIIVHSADGRPQCTTLTNAAIIPSPILYLIIHPQVYAGVSDVALAHVAYAGCSTTADWRFLETCGQRPKGRFVRHSVSLASSIGTPGVFRKKFGITTRKMFLSCGGFQEHKGMSVLAHVFRAIPSALRADVTLVLTGYRTAPIMPEEGDGVRVLHLADKADVADAMADADLYIMNSAYEGFGLVLLESMLNKLPWLARSSVAGAVEMRDWGQLFDNAGELDVSLRSAISMSISDGIRIRTNADAFEYAVNNRLTKNTIDDILAIIS